MLCLRRFWQSKPRLSFLHIILHHKVGKAIPTLAYLRLIRFRLNMWTVCLFTCLRKCCMLLIWSFKKIDKKKNMTREKLRLCETTEKKIARSHLNRSYIEIVFRVIWCVRVVCSAKNEHLWDSQGYHRGILSKNRILFESFFSWLSDWRPAFGQYFDDLNKDLLFPNTFTTVFWTPFATAKIAISFDDDTPYSIK